MMSRSGSPETSYSIMHGGPRLLLLRKAATKVGLFSGAEGGGERVLSTHCLRMRLIATEFRGDRVRTYMYVYL